LQSDVFIIIVSSLMSTIYYNMSVLYHSCNEEELDDQDK